MTTMSFPTNTSYSCDITFRPASPYIPPAPEDPYRSSLEPKLRLMRCLMADRQWIRADKEKLMEWNLVDSSFFQKFDINLRMPRLGQGSYSICRRCIHRVTLKEYAVKIIVVGKNINEEVELLRACQGCPYVIKLHGVYRDNTFAYIVTELALGGDLSKHLVGNAIEERVAHRLLTQLCIALRHLQELRIAHRDFKPDNILLTDAQLDRADVKLVSFHSAKRIPNDNEEHRMLTPTFDLPYGAPELVSRLFNPSGPGYGPQCDNWSLGSVYYYMLSGKPPFANLEQIKSGTYNMDGPIWDNISEHSKRIVNGLLTSNPCHRLTIDELAVILNINLDDNKYSPEDNKEFIVSSQMSSVIEIKEEEDDDDDVIFVENTPEFTRRMCHIENIVSLLKKTDADMKKAEKLPDNIKQEENIEDYMSANINAAKKPKLEDNFDPPKENMNISKEIVDNFDPPEENINISKELVDNFYPQENIEFGKELLGHFYPPEETIDYSQQFADDFYPPEENIDINKELVGNFYPPEENINISKELVDNFDPPEENSDISKELDNNFNPPENIDIIKELDHADLVMHVENFIAELFKTTTFNRGKSIKEDEKGKEMNASETLMMQLEMNED